MNELSLKQLYEKSEKLRKLRVCFLRDKTLFAEGDGSREMYILLSGKVEILKDKKRIAVVEKEGSYLGELSALLGTRRTATVKTMSRCEFIVVDGDKVVDFFASSPPLAQKLARILADRLARIDVEHVKLNRKIDLLTGKLKEATRQIEKRDQQIERLVARIEEIRKLKP